MTKIKDNIEKGISEMYLETKLDFIKESLEEEGVNVVAEEEKIDQYVNRLKFHCKALSRKQRNEDLLAKAVLKFKDAIDKNLDKPIATIKMLIAEKQLQVNFRNLDGLSNDEIKEIIQGKNLVELLEELDEESN